MKLGAKAAPSRSRCPGRCWEKRVEGSGMHFHREAANSFKFSKAAKRTVGGQSPPCPCPVPSSSSSPLPRQRARPARGRARPSLPPTARPPSGPARSTEGLVVHTALYSYSEMVNRTTRPRSQRAGPGRSRRWWVCECRRPGCAGARRGDAVAGAGAREHSRRSR